MKKSNEIRLLALDVATHCGWCTRTASGVWDLSIRRDESSGIRLIRFKAKLKELIELEEIDIIAFERTAGKYKSSIIVQSELHGALKLFLEENMIHYVSYSASEIKKFATGKGNANKEAMIKAAQTNFAMVGDDDNEADAIHIYHFAKKILGI